jgi:deoxyadenosine/deoxycytidine kinase
LEEHEQRPFQALFKNDFHYALPNQLDYLLLRMEQESHIRSVPGTGVVDGGLEMDFYGFTRLFRTRGWLTSDEFDLCRRLYSLVRTLLPPPDLVIHLTARSEVISRRLAGRHRINIASVKDTALLDSYLAEWLSTVDSAQILSIDASGEDSCYQRILPGLVRSLQQLSFA